MEEEGRRGQREMCWQSSVTCRLKPVAASKTGKRSQEPKNATTSRWERQGKGFSPRHSPADTLILT